MKGDYSVGSLAESMAMSPRSLQRRIQDLGTNARTLLDEVRYANALELLAKERISIENIANQLGFDSERGFNKAFKRWAQKTPAQVRREMKLEES